MKKEECHKLDDTDTKKVNNDICPDCGAALYNLRANIICGTCGHEFKITIHSGAYRVTPKRKI